LSLLGLFFTVLVCCNHEKSGSSETNSCVLQKQPVCPKTSWKFLSMYWYHVCTCTYWSVTCPLCTWMFMGPNCIDKLQIGC
jgi:hypothetical protein